MPICLVASRTGAFSTIFTNYLTTNFDLIFSPVLFLPFFTNFFALTTRLKSKNFVIFAATIAFRCFHAKYYTKKSP